MPSLLTDQNFNDYITRGLRRVLPGIEIASVRDYGLAAAVDDIVLELAAREHRVLVTHDARTIEPLFYRRQSTGLTIPGVIVLPKSMPVRAAIEQLWELLITTPDREWEESRLVRLPLG
jgi:hypothetical protein